MGKAHSDSFPQRVAYSHRNQDSIPATDHPLPWLKIPWSNSLIYRQVSPKEISGRSSLIILGGWVSIA